VNTKNLSDLALVFPGYPFRERLDAYARGDVAVLQMKNIDEADMLRVDDTIPRISLPNLNERQFIRGGDLLLRARGQFHTAAEVTTDIGRAVAAAPLMLIRVTSSDLSPAFLRWFINQPQTQSTLTTLAAGTHVRSINKSVLESLQVPVPPIELQERIVDIARLGERERSLMHTLAERRARLLDARLMDNALSEVISL
jgi:Type I restriction modification DNA specificity domain